uniref:Uncharacterized protein n=1 Tax=Triticum urartu TaxID=4572 RepID=A0A8R7UCD2_TRIUA
MLSPRAAPSLLGFAPPTILVAPLPCVLTSTSCSPAYRPSSVLLRPPPFVLRAREHSDGRTYLGQSASASEDYSSRNSCRFVLLAPGVGGEHVLRKRLQKDFSASTMGPCMWDDEGNQSRFSKTHKLMEVCKIYIQAVDGLEVLQRLKVWRTYN